MSVTSALASALTGLTATQRQAEIVSSNVANAATPGYARREVQLGARVLGGTGQGVQVQGVTRQVDVFLQADRRVAEAASGDRDVRASFLQRLEQIFGQPQDAASLSARVAALDSALMEAASRPESEARLTTAVDAARLLATSLNRASDAIQEERLRTDKAIATAIGDVNAALAQVQELNSQIRSFSGTGRDVAALMDQRAQIIDGIAKLVPLREIPRDHDQVALMTTGGAVLLDGKAAVLEFTPVHTIVPEMTQASGGLSGLTINGRPMATAGETSLVLGANWPVFLRCAMNWPWPGRPGWTRWRATWPTASPTLRWTPRWPRRPRPVHRWRRRLQPAGRNRPVLAPFAERAGGPAAGRRRLSPARWSGRRGTRPAGQRRPAGRAVRPAGRGASAGLGQLFGRKSLAGRADGRASVLGRVRAAECRYRGRLYRRPIRRAGRA